MSLQRSGVSNSFGVKSLKAKDFLRGLPLIDAIFLEPRNLFLEKLETIFPDVYSEDSPFREVLVHGQFIRSRKKQNVLSVKTSQ